MKKTRREIFVTAAAVGSITLVPFVARAAGSAPDVFKGAGGEIKVHPISHASFVMEAPMGTIYVDTVGEATAYADKPAPDLILITHRHGDHFNADTLKALGDAPIITNADVHGMMDDALKSRTSVIGHDAGTDWNGATIEAIPAYNKDPETKFHPRARGDNGYVLTMADFRIYISGDTEDIPEMRSLKDIDLAFVCMNLPFTMTAEAAASAVAEFKPKFVYPYHYRGKDGGTQDPKAFASMVGDAAHVQLVDWYPDNPDL
jgi:L-ascorbate metabolism protein UlaG (beta-lactamase superfamily)